MKKRLKISIALRWFINSFAVVVVILIMALVAMFFMLRQYYYDIVGQQLLSEANIIARVLTRHHENFGSVEPAEIRRIVENFTLKNHMELMAIDARGQVILTSSGFSPTMANTHALPDFLEAKANSSENEVGSARYVGFFESLSDADSAAGEKYMAVSVMLPYEIAEDTSCSAVRLVTSLEAVDDEITAFTLSIVVVSVLILLILLLLGLYFVHSIVSPLRRIGNTARRLADGDFSVRITHSKSIRNEDEIGDLCRIINHMADELETSENLKNDFISSVSHELRTPLTAIKGWGETVRELKDDDTTERGMNVIIAETDRLAAMVEELLDFSRIQSGNLSLQLEKLNILHELSAAVDVFAERANREGFMLICEFDCDGCIYIRGDKNRIRQVFINILDNAIKYNKPSGTVTVSAETAQNNVVISIVDSGCGISRADLQSVKLKFFKANNTRRGSGIGLAVADEIVMRHFGELTLKSQLGAGTAVSITLPIFEIS